MSMVFVPPTLRPPSLVPGGCTIPIQGPMPHFEAMPLDGMTMPMAMQPNLNNPCLLRQLRMPMQGLQMVSKSDTAPVATFEATWEPSEENIRPRSSLIQDGSEFMRLLDSLEERVELMNKMQETRQRLQEAWEPSKNEPEGIEDGGLDQPEQEESGAQLLYDQLQHLSPISETPRWCQPDLLEQGAQHPSPANDEEVDGSYAADVRKLLIELERHLEESAKLREDLQMQREESAKLRNDLQMEREEAARLRNDLQMEREESARLQNELQMEREESARLQNELQMEREARAREKASLQSQINEMSKDLPKQAVQESTDWDGGFMVGKNVAMSEDRLVATRSRGTGHTMVVGSSPIRKTLAGWYYEVRICEVESCGISYMDVGGLAIGVTKQSASPDIRMPGRAWRWPETSILGYYGSAYLEGSPQKIEWSPDAESLPVGSIVGLLVTHQGDIQVLVENEEVACLRGVMTLEPETELYPVLDIFRTTRSVELLRPVWSEGSRSVSEGTDGDQ